MYCNYCGAQLPEGTRYCNQCGYDTQAEQYQQPQQYQQQEYQQGYPQQEYPQNYQQGYQQQGYQQYQQYQQYPQYQQPQPQKKSNTGILIAAIGGGLVIVGLLAVLLLGGNSNKNPAPVTPAETLGATLQGTDPVKETEAPPEAQPTEPNNTTNEALSFTPDQNLFSNYKVTLNQVASFSGPERLSFSSHMPVSRVTTDGTSVDTLLSYDGTDKLGKGFHSYDYLGNGLTVGITYIGELPSCELVNIYTGETYLSDGAAKIEQLSDRFFYVIYTTEQTDSKEDCFIYFTDSLFSMSPDEDDVLYKGYAKVFDLQTKQFVPNLLIEDPANKITVCGQTLCMKLDFQEYAFYNADGSVLKDSLEDIEIGTERIFQTTNDGCTIFDSNLNKLGFIEDASPVEDANFSASISSNNYLQIKNEDYASGCVAVDGTIVCDTKYDLCYEAWNDYIIMGADDDTSALYFGDGTELIPAGTYDSIYKVSDLPALKMTDKNDKDFLYLPGGQIWDIDDANLSDGIYYRYVNDYKETEYLIFSTGEWKRYEDSDELTNGLVQTNDGILEVYTGQILLPGEFDWVTATNEHLYIYDNDVWTVYEINFGR